MALLAMQTGGFYSSTPSSNMGYINITPRAHANFPASTMTRSSTSTDLYKVIPPVPQSRLTEDATSQQTALVDNTQQVHSYTSHHKRILLNVSQKKLHNRWLIILFFLVILSLIMVIFYQMPIVIGFLNCPELELLVSNSSLKYLKRLQWQKID